MPEYALSKTREYPRDILQVSKRRAILEDHSFPLAALSENCSFLGTDHVRGQISRQMEVIVSTFNEKHTVQLTVYLMTENMPTCTHLYHEWSKLANKRPGTYSSTQAT